MPAQEEIISAKGRFMALHVGKPRKVEPATCDKMLKQLICRNVAQLKDLLVEAGSLQEIGEAVKFDRARFEKDWINLCLVWSRSESQAVRCTCWHWAWKSYCVHVCCAHEKLGTRSHVKDLLPTIHRSQDLKQGSSEEAEAPRRK